MELNTIAEFSSAAAQQLQGQYLNLYRARTVQLNKFTKTESALRFIHADPRVFQPTCYSAHGAFDRDTRVHHSCHTLFLLPESIKSFPQVERNLPTKITKKPAFEPNRRRHVQLKEA
jgi:hypothetical protein